MNVSKTNFKMRDPSDLRKKKKKYSVQYITDL